MRLQTKASKADVRHLAQWVQLGRERLLVQNVDSVRAGYTKDQVEHILGKADNPSDREWIYYLDDHSGYLVAFDGTNHVERVVTWKD